jgi:glutamine synthetase
LEKALAGAAGYSGAYELGVYFRDKVFTVMQDLRFYGDKLETLVDADIWPLPTYAEMLFLI